MTVELPDWRGAFLHTHALGADYLVSAQKWFDPLAEVLASHQSCASRPYLVAVNGSQGSGKSTLCAYLCEALSQRFALSCLSLSLDDFYLTAAQRRGLAQEVHPLLRTRGVPGTHDMELLAATLGELLAGRAAAVPRFDKARDDRCPEAEWDMAPAGLDIILLEGWCLGALAQGEDLLVRPVNDLESREDTDARWRSYVNEVLDTSFPPLYRLVDEWVMLQAPSFDCVYLWRLEQEQKLAARRGGSGVMNAQEVARFIQFYQRLTEHCLDELPGRVNHLYTLDRTRGIRSYTYQPGAAA